MKTHLTALVVASTLLTSLSTAAHDPSEHQQAEQKPDCTAMQNMDHSKMDMNDPVMQAMMKKCMPDNQNRNQGAGAAADHSGQHATENKDQSAEHDKH